MNCYFLRHGLATAPNEWSGADDARPLTDDGKKRMAREGKTLLDLRLNLDVIVTSPLLRAKQTAAIVAEKLQLQERIVEDEGLGVSFDLRALARVLKDHADANAVMLVGHEPSMSETIGQLIGGARMDFKKGSLACVAVSDPVTPKGELMWLLPPKVLRA
jgi:phosphohistidine phosphatase